MRSVIATEIAHAFWQGLREQARMQSPLENDDIAPSQLETSSNHCKISP